MSEHTPGPWKAEKHHVIQIGTDDVVTSCFYGFANRDNYAEDYATARLIAAAPELLESLKLAKLCIEAMIEDGRCGKTFVGAALTLDKINFAIAKAEGGQ